MASNSKYIPIDLPPDLIVIDCASCRRHCVTTEKLQTFFGGREENLPEEVRVIGGRHRDRPYCEECFETKIKR
jgi:hypothetical protein